MTNYFQSTYLMNKHIFLLLGSGIYLSACSNADLASSLPDNRPNYKQSRMTNPLEIPPDLTQSSIDDTLQVPELQGVEKARLSTYQNERQTQAGEGGLAATLKNIHSDGNTLWIEINASPDTVFADAKQFWISNGLPLKRVDKAVGIMETDWLEAGNDMPGGGLGSLLSGLLNVVQDDGKRDKFRTRIDYDGENSHVYVTHYGATEKQVDDRGRVKKGKTNNDDSAIYKWIASERNPELEVEMLRRLNLYLQNRGRAVAHSNAGANNNADTHADNQAATDRPSETASAAAATSPTSTATMVAFNHLSDGTPVLTINGNFNKAWTLLGVAIDRAGYDITQQNRQDGTYHFNKVTVSKSGLIFKKVSQTTETFTLGLADQGDKQIVVVRSHNNKSPNSANAKSVLQKLSKAINP